MLSIAEASARSGLSVDTIRYYERMGMLPRLDRDARGWRAFTADALDWLVTLERLRATGMPLAEVRRFARLAHAADPQEGVAERLAILERHAERLEAQRHALNACAAFLAHKIAVYRGDLNR